jgi:hypothetical protein
LHKEEQTLKKEKNITAESDLWISPIRLLDFRWLHAGQAGAMLPMSSDPPLDSGMMWSFWRQSDQRPQ